MQCDVRSMSDERKSRKPEEPHNPPQGLVTQVCREWLVHEDKALAQKLQEQEIEKHYGKNRSERRVVQGDLRHAREMQHEEDLEADEIQRMYEQMLIDQELADAQVAKQLQEKESRELGLQHDYEEADKRFAFELQEKEKQRYSRKKMGPEGCKEKRQVEKTKAQVTLENYVAIENELPRSKEASPSPPMVESSSSDERPLDDLTDFCLQPTAEMSEDSARLLREQQDAELARLLQEQETKRRGHSDRDRLLAIEAQDRELAKMLQEQERAKVRRAKERARLKALQKQAEQDGQQRQSPVGESRQYSDYTPSRSQRAKRPSELDVPRLDPGGLDLVRDTAHGRRLAADGLEEAGVNSEVEPDELRPVDPSVNIAIAIDPTYNRRLKKNSPAVARTTEMSSQSVIPVVNGNTSGGSTPVLPSPASIRTTAYHGGDDVYYDSDESPAPPYMPIQGQKRSSASLEKKKKSKESCRQQ